MPQQLAKRIGVVVLALAMANGLVATAYAQNRPNRVEEKLEEARQKQQQVKERIEQIKVEQSSRSAELQLRLAANQERIQEKLSGIKLEACQERQERIVNHSNKITERSANLLQKMESIATKAGAFMDDKGISTAGLTELETEMDASKQAVEAALEAATTGAEEFDCTSDGPKAQLQQFVEAMDVVRESLKGYRDTIHDYIQAIRQANGQNRDGEASSSATPSPEATNSAEEAE